MQVEIITIGDEILIGQIVDSNSAWMATELNKIGIRVKQISSVSDDEAHILEALAEAENRTDIILITGGLGPTKDDITKKTMAKYFGASEMVLHQPTLDIVSGFFARRNLPLTELNRQQAMGTELVKKSLPFFFENLELQDLYCEPYTLNPAPSKTLEKVGFTFEKRYVTVPGALNFEQEVTRWHLGRAAYEQIIADISR